MKNLSYLLDVSKQAEKKIGRLQGKILSNQTIIAYNRLGENNRLRGLARTYSDPPTLFCST